MWKVEGESGAQTKFECIDRNVFCDILMKDGVGSIIGMTEESHILGAKKILKS